MSISSTVSNSYANNNSWLQPKEGYGLSSSPYSLQEQQQQQQQPQKLTLHTKKEKPIIANKTMMATHNANRRPSKQQQNQEGFARSTASSRSRAGMKTDEDIGMSQRVIYEAFAQAEKKLDTSNSNTTNKTQQVRRPSIQTDLRRKSMAETSSKRRPSRVGGGIDSTTATTTTTTNTIPTTQSNGMMTPPQRTRAHSLAVISSTNTRRSSVATTNHNNKKVSAEVRHSRVSSRQSTTTTATTTRTTKRQTPSSDARIKSPNMNMNNKQNSPLSLEPEKSHHSSTCSNLPDQQASSTLQSSAGCRSQQSHGPMYSAAPTTDSTISSSSFSNQSSERQEPGLIRLADALRDSLIVERQKAKRELALHMDPSLPASFEGGRNENDDIEGHQRNNNELRTRTQLDQPIGDSARSDNNDDDDTRLVTKKTFPFSRQKQQNNNSTAGTLSSADIIYHAKRRLSNNINSGTTHQDHSHDQEKKKNKEKTNAMTGVDLPLRHHDPMTSTASPETRMATQTQLERRASLLAYVRQRTGTTNNNNNNDHRSSPSSNKPSSSPSPGSSPDTPTTSTSFARHHQKRPTSLSTSRRPSSTVSTKSSHLTQPSPHQSPVPQRKKSIQQQKQQNNVITPSSCTPTGNATSTVRLRKKSMVGTNTATTTSTTTTTATTATTATTPTALTRRRRSRTESLKEGIPTSPSIHATTTTNPTNGNNTSTRTRKKSMGLSTQDIPQKTTTATTTTSTTKKLTAPPTYTRKRGKVNNDRYFG
ncbi:uncharacterized protein BX664DRAFT_57961 [Halteromyces radiatus]|uniref:uncharacterized protein n=1 Tax=Halteromyces radiatus TaxID=101107 RepID=UPI00221F404B|nr:uncharacterized protein BX664DRAFT_57961 [Halteromyces radiatus]KAI8096368.1 hypothetical protein BX664DRAFT_57961 [Halteromyces radiatus]